MGTCDLISVRPWRNATAKAVKVTRTNGGGTKDEDPRATGGPGSYSG
jgi:hypothetical protein